MIKLNAQYNTKDSNSYYFLQVNLYTSIVYSSDVKNMSKKCLLKLCMHWYIIIFIVGTKVLN